MKLTPNVKKVISRYMAVIAIPHGIENTLQAGAEAILNNQLSPIFREAFAKTETAIEAIKSSHDNPYGDDDEVIAAAILERFKL